MSHTTNVEDFRRFATSLQEQAGIGKEPGKEKFDQSGFERLKMKMKLGI